MYALNLRFDGELAYVRQVGLGEMKKEIAQIYLNYGA